MPTTTAADIEARIEDLAWLAEHWETPREAARRIGITVSGLEAFCKKHAPEVLVQLRANEARRKVHA